jgi:hypothetical protein
VEPAAAGVGEDFLGDLPAVADDLPEGLLQALVEDDGQGAARGLRRALVGAGEAAGDLPVDKRGVVGAVVRERPAEHPLEERLCLLEVGGVELDVEYLVGLVHGMDWGASGMEAFNRMAFT